MIKSTFTSQKLFFLFVVVFLCCNPQVDSIAIDNGIVGKPGITCSEETIQFAFTTQKPFQGRVYVKGRADDANCREEYTNFNATNATYTVKLGNCGMQRLRSIEPLGTQMMITVVVSFHSIFETKVDRAFRIQCMFAAGTTGGSEQRVTQSLEVSMLPTTPLEAFGGMGAGTCSYTVRRGALDGPPLRFAIVGEKAVHVWECEGGENMSILVHSCMASDSGSRVTVPIVNDKGCSVDPVLLENIQYDPKKTIAYANSHVYKYADQATIAFICNIRFCVKGSPECTAATPPTCPVKPVFVDRRRRNLKDGNRSLSDERPSSKYDKVIDVSTEEMLVLPNVGDMATAVFETLSSLTEKGRAKDPPLTDRPSSTETFGNLNSHFVSDIFNADRVADPDDVCVPTTTFAVMVTSTLFAFILCTLIGIVVFAKAVSRFWADRAASKPKRVHYQKKTDHYKEVFVPYFSGIYR